MKIMEDGPKQNNEEAVQINEGTCGCGNYDCNSCFPMVESVDDTLDILAENEIFDEVYDLAEGDDDNTYTDGDYPDVKDPEDDEITDDDYKPKITKEASDEECDDDAEELDEGELPPWLKDKDDDDTDDDKEEVDESADTKTCPECHGKKYVIISHQGEREEDACDTCGSTGKVKKDFVEEGYDEFDEAWGNDDEDRRDAIQQSRFNQQRSNNNNMRPNDPSYDDHAEFEPATNMCPDCEGSGYDGEYGCDRCDGVGEIHEAGDDFSRAVTKSNADVSDFYRSRENDFGDDDMEYSQANAEQQEPEWAPQMAELRALAGLAEVGPEVMEPGEVLVRDLEDKMSGNDPCMYCDGSGCEVCNDPGNAFEAGEESPFTHVMQEEDPEFGDDDIVDMGDGEMDMDMDMAAPEPEMAAPAGTESDDVSELINKIQYLQDMGVSMSDVRYDVEKLWNANPEMIQRIYAKVAGDMQEDAFQHALDGTGKSPGKRFRPKSEWDNDDGTAGLEPEYDDMMDLGHRAGDDPDEMMFDAAEAGTVSATGRKGTLDADAINGLAALDIDSAKSAAIDMITGSSTSDRRRAQLLRNVESARRTDQVISLLYNMLLAGEGMSANKAGGWQKRYEGMAPVPGLNEGADPDVIRAMKALNG